MNDLSISLGQRLLEAGIARKVVTRYLKELEAHYRDLLEQARFQGLAERDAHVWATQRLGSEEQLLIAVSQRPELRSWPHRHPWLSTTLLPIVIYALSLVAVFLLVLAMVKVFAPVDGVTLTEASLPRWLASAISSSIWFLTYGLTPLLACALAIWGQKQYLRQRHQMLSMLFICILGSGMTIKLEWPDPALQRQGMAAVGFGYAWDEHASPEAAFHEGKKLRLTGNLMLCSGLIWLLHRRRDLLAG